MWLFFCYLAAKTGLEEVERDAMNLDIMLFAISKVSFWISMPMNLLFSLSAAIPVVPDPSIGSKITSFNSQTSYDIFNFIGALLPFI